MRNTNTLTKQLKLTSCPALPSRSLSTLPPLAIRLCCCLAWVFDSGFVWPSSGYCCHRSIMHARAIYRDMRYNERYDAMRWPQHDKWCGLAAPCLCLPPLNKAESMFAYPPAQLSYRLWQCVCVCVCTKSVFAGNQAHLALSARTRKLIQIRQTGDSSAYSYWTLKEMLSPF